MADRPLVICVDDNLETLRLMERILQTEGYRVSVVNSGEAALKMISRTKPDAVLLDIMMPEMDGYTVCEMLRRNHATASIPVVFVTALAGEEHKARADAAGGTDYVTKPFQKETLLHTIDTSIKRNKRTPR